MTSLWELVADLIACTQVVLSSFSPKALIHFKNIFNRAWDSPVAWVLRENTKYNKIHVRITHYSRVFEDEGRYLRSFKWKDVRWGGLSIISFILLRFITENKKTSRGSLNVIFNISVSHKSRNLLETSRRTVGLKYTVGAYGPTAALISTTTQGTGLSMIQPVTQGLCQMPCKNPFSASLSCAGSFQRAEREREWTEGYSKHLRAGRKLSSAPNGW